MKSRLSFQMAALLLIMAVVWQAVRLSTLVWKYTEEDPTLRPLAMTGMALTFLVTVPIYNYQGLELFAAIEQLPRQLRAFDIQQAGCACCNRGPPAKNST